MTDTPKPTCIHCEQDDTLAPLLDFTYQGRKYQICTRHLPLLLHQPQKLAGKLPDAEHLGAADHHE